MVEESEYAPVSPTVSGESKAPMGVMNKKKRNLPGMPDPDAEVVTLSPKALLATNRFICEICHKGFQRDQNLQLHRRGHNLPFKLRQRTSKEVKKRVYVCPEPSCVHHDPARALGDLTGIKKHYSRKHGEKKHKCDRCSKKYAVLSDLKAHVKTCGTREYLCDCGTLFSRRDSFVTHRAFCDALAQETARTQPPGLAGDLSVQVMGPPPPSTSGSPTPLAVSAVTPSTDVLSPVLSIQSAAAAELQENKNVSLQSPGILIASSAVAATVSGTNPTTSITDDGGAFRIYSSDQQPESHQPLQPFHSLLRPGISAAARSTTEPISLTLSPSLYGSFPSFASAVQHQNPQYFFQSSPAGLSATALLQKAAQMGATSSDAAFPQGLSLQPSPLATTVSPWGNVINSDNSTGFPTLCLDGSMLRQSSLFNDKQDGGGATTQDFLRLGTGGGYLRSISSAGISGEAFSGMWDDSSERKPSIL